MADKSKGPSVPPEFLKLLRLQDALPDDEPEASLEEERRAFEAMFRRFGGAETLPGGEEESYIPGLSIPDPKEVPVEARPLFALLGRGAFDEAKELLQVHPELINATDADGWNAIFFAAMANHGDFIRWLAARGCDPNARDREGWTAMMETARNGLLGALDALIEVDADVTLTTPLKWSALHQAVLQQQSACIVRLCRAGADAYVEAFSGMRPIDGADDPALTEEARDALRGR